jgi:hypothetical protein
MRLGHGTFGKIIRWRAERINPMSGFRIWLMLVACVVEFASGRYRRWLEQARPSRAPRLRAVRVRTR